ncbi:MAG: hypothetical protein RRY13_02115 [Akkermansia sp.]
MNKIILFSSIAALGLSSSQAATVVRVDFGSKDTAGSVNIHKGDANVAKQLGSIAGTVTLNTSGLRDLDVSGWWEDLHGTPDGHPYADTEKDGLAIVRAGNGTTTPIVITFSGLSAGTYSMEVLSGLYGGNWIGGNLKFAFSGEGTDTSNTDWSSSIVNKGDNGVWHTSATATDSSSLTCPTLRGQGGENDQGALVNASDIIVSENGTLTLTISSDSGAYPINVINNIILTKNDQSVPEASTATLSLLALAGLMLRRRRN